MNHLNTAELKPVIYLKKRWLVLFFLISIILILTFSDCFVGSFHAAAQSEQAADTELEQNSSAAQADKENYQAEDYQLKNKAVEDTFQEKYDFRRDYSGNRLVPVYKVERDDNKIALTIDGAWGSAKTEELLALMKKYDVKTSFFFAGRWLEANQDLVEKILSEGHNIYNHSYTHPHFNSLSREEIEEELLKTEKLITRLREKILKEKMEKEKILIEQRNVSENEASESAKKIEKRFNLPSQFEIAITEDYLKNLSKKTDLKEINRIFLECAPCATDLIYQHNELAEYGLNFQPNSHFYESPIDFEEYLAIKNTDNEAENNIENNEMKDNGIEGKEKILEKNQDEVMNNSPDNRGNSDKGQEIDSLIEIKRENPVKLFRPPYGEYNDFVVKTARELDYQIIQWSLDSHDWMDPGEDYVVNRIKTNVESGDILLFHNNAPNIISILERLIPYLKERYELVQIEELIYHDQYIIRSFDGLQYSIKDDENEN